jgi:hypothetical protein
MRPSGRFLLSFQKRGDADDGFGNILPGAGDFAEAFKAYADMSPMRVGSEAVIAARLAGTQPLNVRIIASEAARTMNSAWRAVDVRNPLRQFNITAIVDPTGENKYLDIAMTEGVVQ